MEHSLHIFVLFLGVNVETRVNVDTQDLPGLRVDRRGCVTGAQRVRRKSLTQHRGDQNL